MDLSGVPCIIRDTAGVRAEDSADEIEREGMRRARYAIIPFVLLSYIQ